MVLFHHAWPYLVAAALSGSIVRHLRISQTGVLPGDGIAAAMLLFFLAISSRRLNSRASKEREVPML